MIEQMKKQNAIEQVKKPYVAPKLTQLGSVQAETQGLVNSGSNHTCFRAAN